MPKNWKYIKKLLEKDFLCEKLRGHITYDLTNYKPGPWYQQHFIMKYDDEVLIEASQPEHKWDKRYSGSEITWGHTDMIAEKIYKKYNLDEYNLPPQILKAITGETAVEIYRIASHHQGIFGVHDIIDAIGAYLHSDIENCLKWGQDDFICALTILDRRCGKRRLEKYADWDYTSFPEWLRRIYQIRFDAEGIRYDKHYQIKNSH